MPLFIVGFARSGTTLCQSLVSQRLVIPTLPETHYFEFLDSYEPAGGRISGDAARALLERLRAFVDLPAQGFPQLTAAASVSIRTLFLRIVGQQIGSQALADQGLWLEKTPGHAEHLERIRGLFPKARILCMVRNPVAAFASRRELMAPGKGWGEEWKPIEAFCAQWATHVAMVRAFAERHPDTLLTIRLEDLAADPERELQRVRAFVGPGFANPIQAPLTPGIIQPFETWKRDALQPADPAIAERAGKEALDAYETWRVKTLLREPMAAFGYDTSAQEPPMDDLHRRLVASLDWYRDAMGKRDAVMDVKTTRIRGLLNEMAALRGEPEPGVPVKAERAARARASAQSPEDAAAPIPHEVSASTSEGTATAVRKPSRKRAKPEADA